MEPTRSLERKTQGSLAYGLCAVGRCTPAVGSRKVPLRPSSSLQRASYFRYHAPRHVVTERGVHIAHSPHGRLLLLPANQVTSRCVPAASRENLFDASGRLGFPV